MTTTECVIGCGRGTDGFACRVCTDAFREELHHVGELYRELSVNHTRRNRVGDNAGVTSRSAGEPLPFDSGASEAMSALHRELRKWALSVAIQRGEPLDVPLSPAALAAWLIERPDALRDHPDAGTLYASLSRAVRHGWRIVDRRPGRIYVGPCTADHGADQCGRDLYARADPHRPGMLDPRQSVVRCDCGAQYDASERREWLLAALRDTLATPAEIAASGGVLAGRPINRKTIATWARNGRINTYGPNHNGYPLHRIGEVVDVATVTATRTRTGSVHASECA